MGVDVVNFGCRLNIAEGEAVRAAAASAGPLTVINSCAVTNEAVRQARQAARRAVRAGGRVIVTGCAAQLDPAGFAGIAGVSGVIGNRDKREPRAYLRLTDTVPDIFAPPPPMRPVLSGDGHARAFVEVQTGCDHRCTFCIIPFARGNSASAPADAVIAAIRAALTRGQQEAVLTGVDLTGYAGGLAPLVARILDELPELPRLRLSSLDPADVDAPLFALLTGEPRLMPHVHLSLQSGDDLILKRMKRRHSRAQAIDLVSRLKRARPDIAIGADLIAGFPTEDAAMAASSLAVIDECDIVLGHVFPYSPRTGTPAARMPRVDPAITRTRAAALRERIATRRAAWLDSLIGTNQRVLVERDGVSGHLPNFARITLPPSPPGSIVSVMIAGRAGDTLLPTDFRVCSARQACA